MGSPAPSQSAQPPPRTAVCASVPDLPDQVSTTTSPSPVPQPEVDLATAHRPPSTVVACDLPAVKSTLVNPATSSTALDFEELTKDTEISALQEMLKERDTTIRNLKEQIVRLTKEKETSKQKLVAAKVQNKDLTEKITTKRKKI